MKVRKTELDEALLYFLWRICSSLKRMKAFRAFVQKHDPTFILPSRKTLKEVVEDKDSNIKEKATADLQKGDFVSPAEMWPSISIDGHIGVTCHYVASYKCCNWEGFRTQGMKGRV